MVESLEGRLFPASRGSVRDVLVVRSTVHDCSVTQFEPKILHLDTLAMNKLLQCYLACSFTRSIPRYASDCEGIREVSEENKRSQHDNPSPLQACHATTHECRLSHRSAIMGSWFSFVFNSNKHRSEPERLCIELQDDVTKQLSKYNTEYITKRRTSRAHFDILILKGAHSI